MPKRGPGWVRVVAGHYRGLRLETRPGNAVRPTADRVKEALFSILAPRIPGAVVVDCFAGTGALGVEALSRGASRVVFVENDPETLAVLERNLDRLSGTGSALVMRESAFSPDRWGTGARPADIILADPPYRRDLGRRFLQALSPETALRREGVLVLEHESEISPEGAGWEVVDRRRYGDTGLTLYRGRTNPKGDTDAHRNLSGDV